MSNRTPDKRPPMAIAMYWVSQITSVGLEMVLPAALGYWLDSLWGISPWLLVVGALLGFTVGFVHLLELARKANRPPAVRSRRSSSSRGKPNQGNE